MKLFLFRFGFLEGVVLFFFKREKYMAKNLNWQQLVHQHKSKKQN